MTQTVLSPIHDHLMHLLRRISSDYTYDQDTIPETVYQMFLKKSTPYSIDLSKATDRFPAKLTRTVMSKLFDSEIGEL